MLTRSYPQAVELFGLLRRENDCSRIDALLGVEVPLRSGREQVAIA
jgi:tRNA-dihydrouridine synthase C